MEKKSGIVVTPRGLFIPARYFERMAEELQVVLSSTEIRIHSSRKTKPAMRKPSRKKTAMSKS
jgi:hypothetical protein